MGFVVALLCGPMPSQNLPHTTATAFSSIVNIFFFFLQTNRYTIHAATNGQRTPNTISHCFLGITVLSFLLRRHRFLFRHRFYLFRIFARFLVNRPGSLRFVFHLLVRINLIVLWLFGSVGCSVALQELLFVQ